MISSKFYGFCVRFYFLAKNLNLGQLPAISNQSFLQIFVHNCDGLQLDLLKTLLPSQIFNTVQERFER
jgi:hypothetical protein